MRTVHCSGRRRVSGVGGGVSARGRVSVGGCLPRGVSAQGDVFLGGVICPSASWDTHPTPWTEFLRHACENITFPQLRLRTVIKRYKRKISYPAIGDANFKYSLWTFEKQLTLKMWVHCGISISIGISVKTSFVCLIPKIN